MSVSRERSAEVIALLIEDGGSQRYVAEVMRDSPFKEFWNDIERPTATQGDLVVVEEGRSHPGSLFNLQTLRDRHINTVRSAQLQQEVYGIK